MAYLKSIVQEYIKLNKSVSTDDFREWFEEYKEIKDVEFFNIIQDKEIR